MHILMLLPIQKSIDHFDDHEYFLFFHSVGNFIIPTAELIFFRGVETTNQFMFRG